MKRKRKVWCNLGLLLVGLSLISISLIIRVYFEVMYDYMINSALTISPTSAAYKVWRKNDPPLIMNMFLFNWTNPEDIENPDIKPRFEEIGPYRFFEVKEKVNLTWNSNNTVTYKHRKSYRFDEKNSVRNLSDMITTLNAVPLTIAFKARNMGYFPKRSISYGLSMIGSSIHVTKTAAEILFDGYEDNILSILSYLPVDNVKDKFGIFYGKNGTIGNDGIFQMSTKNDESFGKLVSWNYRNESSFYKGACNAVKGSTGEFYPINRKRDKVELYSSELCKFAKLEYEKDVTIKGVDGYKYTAKHIFDNGTSRPENACFCVGECIPSGVLNVSSCRMDSPSFLSLPHFYNADPYYINSIEGVKPEPKHEFFITMQPKSAIVMDISAKMQLNFLLRRDPYISLYQKVPEKIFFPIFYFDQNVYLRDELALKLRLIQNLPEYSNYLILILSILGIISVVWSLCLIFYCRKAAEEYKKTIQMPIFEEVPLKISHLDN